MKTHYLAIALAIIFGIFFWVIDAVVGYYVFYGGSFFDVLIGDIPNYAIYTRAVVFACFLTFGLIVTRNLERRRRAEERLQEYRDQLEILVEERTAELEEAVESKENEIIERKEAERKLREAKRAAEEANKAKSDFLANMSHELRTPLNSIIGFSEVMRDGIAGPTSDEQKEYLNDIFESGKHLLNLINDLLDLSKIEAGRMKLEPGRFPLKDFIESSMSLFKEKLAKHQIKSHIEIADEIEMIDADERKLKQILFNLIGNALKFTPDCGQVGVKALRDGSDIIITVWDTGIGIPEQEMRNLFEPFMQIETTLSKKQPGTGLGLSLCKKFVELHGGRIWMESEEGKGSEFSFAIPAGRE